MTQRVLCAAVWLKRGAVCVPTIPSRWWVAPYADEGRDPCTCARAAVTKLTRSITVLEEIHDSLFGQPPTSGGSKRACPMPPPAFTTTFQPLPRPLPTAA